MRDSGFPDELSEIIAQNDAELAAEPALFAPDAVRALTAATQAARERATELLAERERAGLVRRCHGDLHLGNIVLIDGEPTLFDAIEFDPRIATGDVFYDLAFLLMDLIERGLAQAANTVLNRYLMETRRLTDLDALAALPLFLSVRAAIRAKVTAARAKGLDPNRGERTQVERQARDYFSLAQSLIKPPPPRLVAVGGLSGTGKSVLARALAPALKPEPGAVVLRSDVERKAQFGVAETERLPEEAYAREVTARVYAALAAKARRVVAAGHSAVADAVFAEPGERAAIAEAAGAAAFRGLFLSADVETRVARVGNRAHDASDADARIARAQERYDLGAIDWVTVDAGDDPPATLSRARAALGLP
jgi:predicted kinase